VGNLARELAPRILTFDLERLPGRVELDIWHPRDAQRITYIAPDRWSELPRTICASWKWKHENRVHFTAAWEDPADPFLVARTLWQLLDEADIAVTFNGRAADLKWLRQDWAVDGLPLPTPWRDVDLFLIARRHFAFESRSLRHLCERLGLPNKAGHYEADTARAAMDGDEKAQRRLAKYSRQDSRITEAVFDRLLPYVTGINLGLLGTDGARVCTNCGSENLEPAGWAMTAVTRYPSYRCSDCQTLMRGKHRSAAVPMRGIVR
jgi:hypothetical protein